MSSKSVILIAQLVRRLPPNPGVMGSNSSLSVDLSQQHGLVSGVSHTLPSYLQDPIHEFVANMTFCTKHGGLDMFLGKLVTDGDK